MPAGPGLDVDISNGNCGCFLVWVGFWPDSGVSSWKPFLTPIVNRGPSSMPPRPPPAALTGPAILAGLGCCGRLSFLPTPCGQHHLTEHH